jgi:transposase
MHSILLPDPALFEVISYSLEAKVLTLEVRTKRGNAKCPDCHQISNRIYSRYARTVRDLPMAGFAVILHICVRRFFCDNPSCPRCTFTERLSGIIESYARRTNRTIASQREVGFIAGGEAGAKIIRNLALPTSPDTLIRLVRYAHIKERPTPKILGIDDWALRRGHSYGTVFVDLETHRPVDLLPDRSAETVKQWLLAHPGVEIISRDRSSIYIETINSGAPNAIQVADRWHLLHNLVEAIERVLNRRYKVCQEAFHKISEEMPSTEKPAEEIVEEGLEQVTALEKQPTRYEQQRQHMREKRQAQLEEVHRLRQEGYSIRAICPTLCMGRRKVRKYLANSQPPEYKRRRQKTILDPYWSYLEQRWTEGCRNGMELWKEIRGMGYSGTYQSMARQIVLLRKRMPREKKRNLARKQQIHRPPASTKVRPFSVRQTAWLFVKDRAQIEGEKSRYFDQLLEISEDFQRLYFLVQQFWEIIAERKRAQLDDWLKSAKNSGIVELRYFAQGLEKDLQAVKAALIYEWSNGPVEGHNNRLKMIKRQMYGRAKFDLLRQRILYSPS